jgi:hypothetical protein
MWLPALWVIADCCILVHAAAAQGTALARPVLRGTVTDTGRRALPNVSVEVRDTTGHTIARALTTPNGTFQITTVVTGMAYRATARRIGFVPRTLLVHPLAAGDTVTLHFMLRDTTRTLARVEVRGRAAPRPYTVDSTAIANVATRDAYGLMIRYPWMLGDGLIECWPDTSHLTIGDEIDDTRETPHWFPPASSIPIGEPLRLFVDGQLRAEQSIKNILADIPSDSIAEMHYIPCNDRDRPQLRNSLVIILKHPAGGSGTRPVLSPQPVTRPARVPVGAIDTTVRVTSTSLSGVIGVVVDSLHGAALSGAIIDVDGTGREGMSDSAGRYRIDSIPPGTHRLGLFHPLLDTLGLSIVTNTIEFVPGQVARAVLATPSPRTLWHVLCGADTSGPTSTPGTIAIRHTVTAAVVGRVVDADAEVPVAGATVTLTWTELQLGKETGMHRAPQTRTATTDASGAFRLCAVPGPVDGTLQAALGQRAVTGEIPLRVGAGELVLTELHIATSDTAAHITVAAAGVAQGQGAWPTARTGPAVVTGRVVTGSGAPISGAAITVLGAAPSTLTQDSGAFALAHLPAGSQTLIVRAIGYAPAEVLVALTSRTPAHVSVTLVPAPSVLPAVHVEGARSRAFQKIGFTEREKMGFGHFLSDSDLARHATANEVAELFDGVPGVRVAYVKGDAVLQSTRGGSIQSPTGCVVYVVDDAPVVSADTGAVNIDQYVRASDIGAAEVYQPSEVPGEFAVSGKTACVTVVIWTKAKLGVQ